MKSALRMPGYVAREVAFFIPGPAVAKARARTFFAKNLGRIVSATPERTKRYESEVKLFAAQAMRGAALLAGAVELSLTEHRKKPAGARRGQVWPTTRPDVDNVLKSIKDGLNGVVYADDSQVVRVVAEKRYALPGAQLGVEVLVRELIEP